MALVERELQESQRQSTDDHFGENLPDGRQLRQSTKQLEVYKLHFLAVCTGEHETYFIAVACLRSGCHGENRKSWEST